MNIIALFIFVIGAIIAGYVESIVFDVGGIVLDQLNCSDASSFQDSCNSIKSVFYLGTKILFPMAGGLVLLGVLRRIMSV